MLCIFICPLMLALPYSIHRGGILALIMERARVPVSPKVHSLSWDELLNLRVNRLWLVLGLLFYLVFLYGTCRSGKHGDASRAQKLALKKMSLFHHTGFETWKAPNYLHEFRFSARTIVKKILAVLFQSLC